MTGVSNKAESTIIGSGWVIWVTGLSGSGKTCIAGLLFERFRQRLDNVIWLDGDVLRNVFGQDLGYSWEDRLQCATRYVRLGKMLSEQGHHVIISTVSMLQSLREWNRSNYPYYYEIYLRATHATLNRRGVQGYCREKTLKENKEIVGVDLPFEEPQTPDLIVDTDEPMTPLVAVEIIWSCIGGLFPFRERD